MNLARQACSYHLQQRHIGYVVQLYYPPGQQGEYRHPHGLIIAAPIHPELPLLYTGYVMWEHFTSVPTIPIRSNHPWRNT